MKKISILFTIVLCTLIINSCKKFLQVNPRAQISKNILFSNETGFKDALIGVYLQMKNRDTYTGNLTQTAIENLTSSWDVTASSTEEKIGLFNYNDTYVQHTFEGLWRQQYTTISSINGLLSEIDARKGVFTSSGMYELIKGESLALRAYLHFDILRLFGPIPTQSETAALLPYVTKLSIVPNQGISYLAFKEAIFKDLNEAELLLKTVDPIVSSNLKESKDTESSDSFLSARNLRMNYYAIKALQARVYLWFGEKNQAYICAKEVIDAKNDKGARLFTLGTAADFSAADYVLTKEHIFGLYDFDMANAFLLYYETSILKKGTSSQNVIKTVLYENSGVDIRENELWKVNNDGSSTAYVIQKYKGKSAASTDYKKVPMLRLSEMYLIAAETAPLADGITYFNSFKKARNLPNTSAANTPDLLQEIIKEYRKEFYAEGQAFFAYKRLNVSKAAFLFLPRQATINYVVPVPTAETLK